LGACEGLGECVGTYDGLAADYAEQVGAQAEGAEPFEIGSENQVGHLAVLEASPQLEFLLVLSVVLDYED